ncbi:ExsB protein [Legionella busanensis]|uniref:7-cyano-7-deazaguanine synthase n=1 Tax=Legionella busanensis TaxID=190655 RepID=A0A378JP82_9GAMM|nr:7-cyano-7-deazaguanine synthase QueC [Legionella busanensis]STX52488.1 ExsB protein [Legionella busanensis]
MNKRVIVLLSGGMDSSTCLALVKSKNYDCYAISFDYGQPHQGELAAAKRVAEHIGVQEHKIFTFNMAAFGGTVLNNHNYGKTRTYLSKTLPVVQAPSHNPIFLAIAIGWGELIDAYDIFIGATTVDWANNPDCTPKFLNAFEKAANYGTKAGISGMRFKIHAPFNSMSKGEIVKKGLALDFDYSLTLSCYQPEKNNRACGVCHSCRERKEGFQEAGVFDPVLYAR